jgi:hypothetical protein
MKVQNEINIYEINDQGDTCSDKEKLFIESHWNYDDRVVLSILQSDGKRKRITVIAADLQRAIQNAIKHKGG